MQINKMKNMIVLNNLPSNVVEEAFVVLKPNIKFENNKIENSKIENVLKEAENVVSSYVEELKRKNEKTTLEKQLEKKCKILKCWNIGLLIFSALVLIISF